MGNYVSNRDGAGTTDEKGHYKFLSSIFSGNVVDGLTISQHTPANMSVVIAPGDLAIQTQGYSYFGWADSNVFVQISPANTSYPRIDLIVAYIDMSVISASRDVNNPNALKFISVPGTAQTSPVQASASTIQQAVGGTNPYTILGMVTLPAGASTVINSYLTQMQTPISLSTAIDVTDNVNWNTLGGNSIPTTLLSGVKKSASLPVSSMANIGVTTAPISATLSLESGWGSYLNFTRTGNIVMVYANYVVSSFITGDPAYPGETIPLGFRPVTDAGVLVHGFVSNATYAYFHHFYPDGSMQIESSGFSNSATRLMGSSAYITNDPWPSTN